MSFQLFSENGETNITVLNPGEITALQIHSSHPNFSTVLQACLDQAARGVNEVIDSALFDLETAISNIFAPLSERVSVLNGALYFDGDLMENELADHIIAAVLDENVDEYGPWVAFLECLYQNPNEHTRAGLFAFLRQEKFTLTEHGHIVGYKSVWANEEHGYVSNHSNGTAFVNGQIFRNVQIPNTVGAVVTMPRSTVKHDPYAGCSVGLHVGTHEYAKNFSGDTLVEIHFNPRDVVSVPERSAVGKVRVSRYYVAGVIGARQTEVTRNEDGSVEVQFAPKHEALVIPASAPVIEQDGHPLPADWTDLVDTAKRQKKGVFALASRKGWKLVAEGANPKARESWTIPA